ncbi:MAG: HNH endonuclease [Myxococcaceae bacterium]|nr:HNH endonuclease [Myxococcaceae bacterium]
MSTQALRKKTKPAARGPCLLALLLCVTACATDSGVPRGFDPADTGSRIVLMAEGAPLKVVRPPARLEPVELTQAEYEAAMVRLVSQLRKKLPPRPEKRLEVISWGNPEERNPQDELVQEYLQWCEERGTPGDCWNVLKGQRYLSDKARRDLAFALATEGVWLGTAAVIDEVLDPVQLQLAIMVSLTTTMALLAIPEPISKLIVIGLTLSLVAYVGWDALSGIIEGWRHMDAAARRARTFSELRAAGRRFGQVLGEKVTRLLILAATAALGSAGGAGVGGGGAQLPQLAQASRMATAQGLPFRAMGQVKSLKVTGRILTVSMEPGALLMANQGMSNGGGSNSPPSAPAPASKYRLTSVESWRKPRLTEDGRIHPYEDSQNPWRLIENKGRDRAGKTITNGQATIQFDKDGFPKFNTKFETLLDDIHIGNGNPKAHLRASNEKLFRAIEKDPSLAKELSLSPGAVDDLLHSHVAPPGYTWHHHQDVGRMQLVPLSEHGLANSHTGGMAIWGGGYR